MTHVLFLCFLSLTAGIAVPSSLRTLDKPKCNQPGLDNCKINSCSDNHTIKPAYDAPNGPEWGAESVGVWMDKHGPVSVMNITWKIKPDANALVIRGSQINILDESTNQNMCVQFSYKLANQKNPYNAVWTFFLDRVTVEPAHTYLVSVFNFPKRNTGEYNITKRITIPGLTTLCVYDRNCLSYHCHRCGDKRVQKALMCLQNGSLWDPHMNTTVSVDREHEKMSIIVIFEAAQYSEKYQVSLQNHGFHLSKDVFKENRTSLNVTLEVYMWQLSVCEMSLMIQPFFIRCKNDCQRHNVTFDYCPHYPQRAVITKALTGLLLVCACLALLLRRALHKDPVNTSSSAGEKEPECFQVQERKKVLIIYSLDHPLYKNIVLKLCAFLANKCGTEVVLDLLDSTRLGMLGSIQWLDWQREQISNSSNKILILCSRGVQVKWRAMCGEQQVFLKEDIRSPVGDMLSPALSLMVPHFIRSSSFEKYIVAYFDDVCSEEDVPSPFKIAVRYKLMTQFEELFFRILGTEKHTQGRVNHIEGFSETEYFHCPSGRALRDAIEAFHTYQVEHPQWFEDELLESSEMDFEEASAEICERTNINLVANYADCLMPDSTCHVINHVKTQEMDLTENQTGFNMTMEFQLCSSADFKPHVLKSMQPVT